ncbi:MAG TPA: PQQ-dependent sugar dehydrogenase [Burkholderiales bacterium]|nr:PQQ-dependent sugar dehydrogenase [Burkholderiales bacterium]
MIRSKSWIASFILALLVAGCDGGSGDMTSTTNRAPVASIVTPLAGATFRAGDTVNFSGSGSDLEDGSLAAARLAWWAELHHDTHTHPFHPETVGNSGSVSIPTRGETSSNIFYRFHLRATDSAGLTNEVTRDIQPQKSQITLATVPAGLALTLDGQPVTTPITLTGVVGIERDIGAANQNANGRRYSFSNWSDGMTASHTISTPPANTTYTATFTDTGPVNNQAPTVSLTAPANGASGTVGTPITLSATAADSDGSVTKVEFFDGAIGIGEDTTSPYSGSWTPTTTGPHSLTARATDDIGAVATSAAIGVTINPAAADTLPPTVTITAPANFTSGITGTLVFNANATDNFGVSSVEFQVDGISAGAAQTAAPYSVSVNTNVYASGQHVLRVRARDAAGNQSAWTTAIVSFGGNRTQPAGFTRNEVWITGLNSATAFAQAPDGRLFVAQQGGALRVIQPGVQNGVLLGTMLSVTVDPNGERGLLGVALHPNFANNGFVYVYYTSTETTTHNRISRFTATGNVASNEEKLVELPTLSGATNHNGGAMHFGLDGKLYVAVGDNANGANSQNPNSVLGKMLRFNDDGTIPNDNPICTTAGVQRCAVWASGLRNPFTFAVQPGTGRIHINDVGQNTWEEINLGAPGANYGWPASEGPDNVGGGVTGPLFTYKHSATSPAGSGPGGFFVGFAIAGGSFYPDAGPFPVGYRNSYYFADFVGRFIGRFDWINNATYAFANVLGEPVDLLTGSDGALYMLARDGITRFSAP